MIDANTYEFILIILILSRVIGGIIFLDFYRSQKLVKFLQLALGCFLFASSPLIEFLLIRLTINSLFYEFFYIFSEILVVIAIYLFIRVFFQYISLPEAKKKCTICLFIVVVPVIFFPFLSFEIVYNIIQVEIFLLILIVSLYIFQNQNELARLSSHSTRLFLTVAILVFLNLISSLFTSNDLIILIKHITNIILSSFGLFVFIYFEYTLTLKQKSALKDEYSHSLSQITHTLLCRFEYILLNPGSENIKSEVIEAKNDCKKISELVSHIREI